MSRSDPCLGRFSPNVSTQNVHDVNKTDLSSTAEKLQFTRTVTQSRRRRHWTFECILSFNPQVDILDLPAVVHHRWPDETKHLFKDAQTGFVPVDGPGHCHQHQAVRGEQRLQALLVQVGTEKESLFPGQRQETQVHELCALKLLRLCTDSSQRGEMELSPVFPPQGLETLDISSKTGIVFFFKVMIGSRKNQTFKQFFFFFKYKILHECKWEYKWTVTLSRHLRR